MKKPTRMSGFSFAFQCLDFAFDILHNVADGCKA